jgi:carboxymethylenebutenolidase
MSSEEPARTGPGVVLVGVPADEHALMERYAARGYIVRSAAVTEDAPVEDGLDAVRAAMDGLATRPDWNGQIAVAGYGHGGRYAFLAVTRLGADAAVAFHGIGIGQHLDEASRVKKPLSFHFADADEFVPFEEVRAIKGALEGFGTTEIYRYPGAHQGFALAGSAGYDEEAAAQAERRAFAVLERLRTV